MVIASYDRDAIRAQFNAAQPFRWFSIAPFLDEGFARELADSYPSFTDSRRLGFEFSHLNEQRKVQISDSAKFPEPVQRLAAALASPAFLADLQPVHCPPERARQSFAAYYYTAEAPAHWRGKGYDTIFRARPDEQLRGHVLMPLERAQRRVQHELSRVARGVGRLIKRA
jgi:hypothetical protein